MLVEWPLRVMFGLVIGAGSVICLLSVSWIVVMLDEWY